MNNVAELLKMRGKISDSNLLDEIEKYFIPIGEIKLLPGLLGLDGYAVTSEGQAISPERELIDKRGIKRLIKKRILKKTITKEGRVLVSIKGNPFQLSTLIAKAFVPNPYNYRFVEHINGNLLDNRADNLIWSKKGY